MRELGRQKPHIFRWNGAWTGQAKNPLMPHATYSCNGYESYVAAYVAISFLIGVYGKADK